MKTIDRLSDRVCNVTYVNNLTFGDLIYNTCTNRLIMFNVAVSGQHAIVADAAENTVNLQLRGNDIIVEFIELVESLFVDYKRHLTYSRRAKRPIHLMMRCVDHCYIQMIMKTCKALELDLYKCKELEKLDSIVTSFKLCDEFKGQVCRNILLRTKRWAIASHYHIFLSKLRFVIVDVSQFTESVYYKNLSVKYRKYSL